MFVSFNYEDPTHSIKPHCRIDLTAEKMDYLEEPYRTSTSASAGMLSIAPRFSTHIPAAWYELV